MSTDADLVAEQLTAIADTLADLALDRLRQASDMVRDGGEPDPALVAEEKRITRARRAVEKAVQLLGTQPAAGPLGGAAFDDGP